MKSLTRIFILGSIMLAMAIFAPQTSKAQILKKLTQKLEKVNNALDKVNEGVEDVMNGDLDGLFKSRNNRQQQNSSNDTASEQESAPEEVVEEAEVLDESDMDEVEIEYPVPFITENTKYMQLPYIGDNAVSSVHDGVFAVSRQGAFSFWRITGEKLFDFEWEYCSELRSYGTRFPEFHNGVAVARKYAGMYSKGTIHLLYLDGSIKELDPDWSQVSQFEDGLAVVTDKSNFQTNYFYINTLGERVYPHLKINGNDEWSIRPIRDGLRAYASGTYTWGYIDTKGNVALKPQYGGAADFSEGYAWVCLKSDPSSILSDGEIVLINTQGDVLYRSGLRWSGSNFKQGYQSLVSDVVDGCFYVRKGDYYYYYNTLFEQIGIADYGSPFYAGMAYIAPTVDLDCDVCIVDTNFDVVRRLGDKMMFATDLRSQPRFTSLGVATVKDKSISSYVISPSGGVLIDSYDRDGDHIGSFWQFTESGMMRATDIRIRGVRYQGILNTAGEMEWLFGEEPADDSLIIIDTDIDPIGPIKRTTLDYDVTVKCSPAEGGSASISPTGRFKYGEEALLSATPNEDWAVTHIEVGEEYYGFAPKLNEPFYVTENMDITVHFAKRDKKEAPPVTNSFAGVKSFDIDDDYTVDITIYAELDTEGGISTPYGEQTYGYIVAMFDPTYRFVTPNIATYIFGAPLRVHSYQHDKENDLHWLVVDGGSYTFGNLKATPNNGNSLDAMLFNMMIAFDGFSSPSITPRHYRIEMLDYDAETGEFTCGKIQTYSPKYGWLWGGDKRLVVKSKGMFSTKTDYGLPDNLFEGVRMKCSPKRNDVWWFPPLLWYDGNQSALDSVVEQMGRSYREYKSEYDILFGE
ncbi:MAG: WG repeat-containing protein [Alistipes sp.]|nr:WG repeat-containing protein [Alistipes sp.]